MIFQNFSDNNTAMVSLFIGKVICFFVGSSGRPSRRQVHAYASRHERCGSTTSNERIICHKAIHRCEVLPLTSQFVTSASVGPARPVLKKNKAKAEFALTAIARN
jgi:hypothetical protein